MICLHNNINAKYESSGHSYFEFNSDTGEYKQDRESESDHYTQITCEDCGKSFDFSEFYRLRMRRKNEVMVYQFDSSSQSKNAFHNLENFGFIGEAIKFTESENYYYMIVVGENTKDLFEQDEVGLYKLRKKSYTPELITFSSDDTPAIVHTTNYLLEVSD